MKVQLKSITPNAEINIVEIARVSSSRTDKTEKPDGLINYLINNKHWSPFEHSFLTFEIETSKAIEAFRNGTVNVIPGGWGKYGEISFDEKLIPRETESIDNRLTLDNF